MLYKFWWIQNPWFLALNKSFVSYVSNWTVFIKCRNNLAHYTRVAIEKNNNTGTVQAESSKFASLSFDQRFQIVIPPRIVANVPEPIGTPSDGILHWSNCWLFRQYFAVILWIINKYLIFTSKFWGQSLLSQFMHVI